MNQKCLNIEEVRQIITDYNYDCSMIIEQEQDEDQQDEDQQDQNVEQEEDHNVEQEEDHNVEQEEKDQQEDQRKYVCHNDKCDHQKSDHIHVYEIDDDTHITICQKCYDKGYRFCLLTLDVFHIDQLDPVLDEMYIQSTYNHGQLQSEHLQQIDNLYDYLHKCGIDNPNPKHIVIDTP
jgi:hypothetical protein